MIKNNGSSVSQYIQFPMLYNLFNVGLRHGQKMKVLIGLLDVHSKSLYICTYNV